MRFLTAKPGGGWWLGCSGAMYNLLPVGLPVSGRCSLELFRICLHLLQLVCDSLDGGCLLVGRVDDNGGLQVDGLGRGLRLVVRLLQRVRVLVGCIWQRGLVSVVGHLPPCLGDHLDPAWGEVGERRCAPGLPGDSLRRSWQWSLGRKRAAGVQWRGVSSLAGRAVAEVHAKAS